MGVFAAQRHFPFLCFFIKRSGGAESDSAVRRVEVRVVLVVCALV